MIRRLFAALAFSVLVAASARAGCAPFDHAGASYTVCTFDPARDKISLFNLDEQGLPLGTFSALEQYAARNGRTLTFAMNAGMYGADLRPIGLYVENGRLLKRLNRRSGRGNFHLKPNGVFYVTGGSAGVAETEAYAQRGFAPDFATQSGPMLVIDGQIHPKFSANGVSAKIRNGVGIRPDGTVAFVLAEQPVNFHAFASMFKDGLQCQNALFLDGSVSALYARELGRNDGLAPLGPMVAVTELR